ncbi:RNA exonuclease 4-like [Panonychus citri]|uniref:RNA exonuclease 4-like n=1 Tax=Panonychus citri TaxID=50023 RepID=UPI002307A14D|nr:RNA exonuclease 4-like [Panonychus citri]
MDCEMVGVGEQGKQSVLARVSLVNQFGNCIYDKYVKPLEPVTDYRTSVSGIRPEDIANGEDFKTVQKEVYDIVSPKNRILVGHALRNDLRVLILDHIIPKSRIRDTAIYFKKMLKGKTPSLKRLTSQLLGANIQCGEHDSVQDAKAAMMLYTMYKKKWSQRKRKLNNQLLNK